MVTRHGNLTAEELDELEREDALYQEMFDDHHDEWFAITRGQLFRAASYREVAAMLAAARADHGGVVISFMGTPRFRASAR